jgi:hypothetical protein
MERAESGAKEEEWMAVRYRVVRERLDQVLTRFGVASDKIDAVKRSRVRVQRRYW